MTAPAWIVKSPAELLEAAEALVRASVPDRGVAWSDQFEAAKADTAQMMQAVGELAPGLAGKQPRSLSPDDRFMRRVLLFPGPLLHPGSVEPGPHIGPLLPDGFSIRKILSGALLQRGPLEPGRQCGPLLPNGFSKR